jgi:hypothetical protein
MELAIEKPIGCQASVTHDIETVKPAKFLSSARKRLVAQIICGQLNNSCTEEYSPGWITSSEPRLQAAEQLTTRVQQVLSSMCLGCPHNTSIVEVTPVIES